VLLIVCIVLPAAGANLQGLKWGFNPGDKINYQYSLMEKSPALTLNEGSYLQINGTSAIPDTVNLWTDIPHLTPDWKWSNGSMVGIGIWLTLLPLGLFGFVVPTGNWSLLYKLAAWVWLWNVNTTMTLSSAYLAFSLTSISSGKTTLFEASYLKSDGFLARYHWVQTDSVTHEKDYEVSLIRQGLPNDIIVMLQDNIVYIGIGVVILVLLLALVRKRR
jgi:hypothetical protein